MQSLKGVKISAHHNTSIVLTAIDLTKKEVPTTMLDACDGVSHTH